jgi:tRNA pseudouridine38-40 synthase
MSWRVRLDVEYDGSAFAGWQTQPDSRTVQGVLEDAFTVLFGRRIRVVGAGRTDAGVHALGQVAHADLPGSAGNPAGLASSLSALTPDSVVVHSVCHVSERFHARRSALWRRYRYRLRRGRVACGRQYVWAVRRPFTYATLRRCAETLPGEHAFTSFCVAKSASRGTVCRVLDATWQRTRGEYWFQIRANRFVHGMVRSLVGTMLAAAQGKMSEQDFAHLFEYPHRRGTGPVAPPRGLCLVGVGYGDTD